MGGKVLVLESERLRAEGKAEGKAEEAKRLGVLIDMLLENDRISEARAVATDEAVREKMYLQYNL